MLKLQGKLLKIATNDVTNVSSTKYEYKEKYLSDMKILKILSSKLNFTFSLIHSDFHWGHLLPNNTWTGIIGKLVTQVTK